MKRIRTEVFFRIKALIDGEWVQSKTKYPTYEAAKQEAEDAMYAPDEYEIVKCGRSIL